MLNRGFCVTLHNNPSNYYFPHAHLRCTETSLRKQVDFNTKQKGCNHSNYIYYTQCLCLGLREDLSLFKPPYFYLENVWNPIFSKIIPDRPIIAPPTGYPEVKKTLLKFF